MVDPKIGDKVPNKHVVEAVGLGQVEQGGNGDGNSHVTQDNELGILSLKQRAGGVEVVDTPEGAVLLALAAALPLALMEVMTSDVGHDVVGPADELLSDEMEEGDDGRFLANLRDFMHQPAQAGGLLLTGSRQEDHVPLHVTGRLVVFSVRNLPAEVGDEECRVENPANSVVENLGRAKGLMTALVSQHPHACGEHALQDGVQTPERGTNRGLGDVLRCYVGVEQVKRGGEQGDISEDVTEASEGRPVEAVLGNRVVDFLDRVIGNLEDVAIGVAQQAHGPLLLVGGERG